MRILHLTPGTGSFFCGSCLRDATLVKALRERGHDALMMPLYLPFVLEGDERGDADQPVHLGGINLYLQQRLPALARLPRWMRGWLDRPGLLRWAARRASMTDAAELGELAVSTLRGAEGGAASEVLRLAHDLALLERPDVLCLSNALLLGLAQPLRRALGVPIAVSLQGEAPFLDGLPEPHRARAWEILRRHAGDADAFLAVSRYTAELMRERLGLAAERVHVVHNGIELADFAEAPRAPEGPPTVGFLARLCRDKGLPVLVDAWLRLKESGTLPGLRLAACGAVLAEDRALVDALRAEVRARGFGDDFELLPNVDRATKLAFLRRLQVLSVPATYGESFGLYLLEALASGVPVVQPRHGAFPELLEATGGGILCEPDDPASLAQALEHLLGDPELAADLGRRGREAVRRSFSAAAMAEGVERVLGLCPAARATAAV